MGIQAPQPRLTTQQAVAAKDFIAVLKNDNRDLLQDFYGLQEQTPVKTLYFRQRRCLCRDIEGFTSWTQFGRPVRIVQSVETRTVRRQHPALTAARPFPLAIARRRRLLPSRAENALPLPR